MTPSYTHRVPGGPTPRRLEAKGLDIDIPILEIAQYCKENGLGEVERSFCCVCKPSTFGGTVGSVARCPCHKLPCAEHALCRERALRGSGCRRCKFIIPVTAPRTQVDREILARQKASLTSRLGAFNVEGTARQTRILIQKYHDEEVSMLQAKVKAQAIQYDDLKAWVRSTLANLSPANKDFEYEITLLKDKVSSLVVQFGQLEKKMEGAGREDQAYDVSVLNEKMSALALQIGQIGHRGDNGPKDQGYEVTVLADKFDSLAHQFGLLEAKTNDNSDQKYEIVVLQEKVAALTLQVGSLENKMIDDTNVRQLEGKVEYLLKQQRTKGAPELVHLGNGRMGSQPDGFGARPAGLATRDFHLFP